MSRFIDLTGKKYGKLTVIEFDHISENGKIYYWKCRCECGNEVVITRNNLKNNHHKRCGKCSNNIFYVENDYMVGVDKNGAKFTFDIEDCEKVTSKTWHVDINGYVQSTIKGKRVFLHRFIMNPPKGMVVDHIDHQRSNCRKENMRICTKSQNGKYRKRSKNNTSGFKGVTFAARRNKWQAQIRVNRKQITLGYYSDKIEAARKYNEAALKYFGEFALLNSIPNDKVRESSCAA